MNNIIKVIRKCNGGSGTRIVIDKLVSPLEVLYFRERYSSFFLFAINHDNNKREFVDGLTRAQRNKINGVLSEAEKKQAESVPSKLLWKFFKTSINDCITLADIHINNNGKLHDLCSKIANFASLILHPGLVQPTAEERVMQIAYTASLSSGCISRQVGAVVTNSAFSVKAVGWNSAPKGQLPCTLRSFLDVHNNCWYSEYFSPYEKSNADFSQKFQKLFSKYKDDHNPMLLNGIPFCYCFKDIYTSAFDDEQRGNQVHTRSLHAEENAFLQLAKFGSSGIKGGYLFTTDQCCVLCAKKAYQLGISKIFYIDPYADIAPSHILRCPDIENAEIPELVQFEGAVGPAYSKLYVPFFSQKDEICSRLGVNMRDSANYKTNDGNETLN